MKSPGEEFDYRVRQRLQDSNTHDSGWDIPSGHVWDNVARRIKTDRRRRWGFWWILAGAMISMGIGGVMLRDEKPGSIPDAPPLHTQKAPVNSDITNVDKPLSAQIFKETDGQVKSREPRSSVTNPMRIKSGTQSPGAPLRNSNALDGKSTNPPGIQQSAPAPDAPLSALDVSSKGVEEMLTDASPSMGLRRTYSEMQFLSVPQMQLSRESTTPVNLIVPLITRHRRPGVWSVAGTVSPSLGTRQITVPKAQPRVRRDLLLQQEEPTLQASFGLRLMNQFHPRWSIGLGLEYGRYVLNGNATRQIRFTRAGERLNGRGNFENLLRLNMNTSYGELYTDVVVERSSDVQIEENRFINLALETRHVLKELRLPLSVVYHVPAGQWQLSCYAGLSANFVVENALTFQAVHSLNDEIQKVTTSRKIHLANTMNIIAGYHFGFSVDVPLERKWSILAGPSISGSLVPVFEGRQVKIYPTMIDFDMGMQYRF